MYTTTTHRPLARAFAPVAMASLLALAITFLNPVSADASQFNATVRGKVTDVDGNPIEGAKVTLRQLAQDPSNPREPIVLDTDDEGNFYARNVSLGETVITFEYEGMETHEEIRDLRAGPVRIDITLNAVEIPEEFVRAQVANEAYGAGVDAFNAGDFEEAVSLMNTAIEAVDDTPENSESLAYIYAVLGASYSRQQMFGDAVAAFTKRLEYAPDDAEANLDLAQALADTGDEAAAQQYFQAALELEPSDAITLYNVGVTMVNAGDVAGGVARIERAIELQPEYPLAHKNLGYAYARQEEYAKAIASFEKYLEQAPDAEDAAQIRDFITALKDMIG